jgi:hypothetical protein
MLTSTHKQIPYVESGDAITDYPTVSALLATRLDPLGKVCLFDSVLGADAPNFNLASIPATFADLEVSLLCRTTQAIEYGTLSATFNGDTAGNYDGQKLVSAGATNTASESLTQTAMYLGDCPGASATAGFFGAFRIWVPNYAGTIGSRILFCDWFSWMGLAAGKKSMGRFCWGWRAGPAVNRITITAFGGNFLTGSRCTIYGVGKRPV